jgi:hypothetical protein
MLWTRIVLKLRKVHVIAEFVDAAVQAGMV